MGTGLCGTVPAQFSHADCRSPAKLPGSPPTARMLVDEDSSSPSVRPDDSSCRLYDVPMFSFTDLMGMETDMDVSRLKLRALEPE